MIHSLSVNFNVSALVAVTAWVMCTFGLKIMSSLDYILTKEVSECFET
jgi:hypothetical protein